MENSQDYSTGGVKERLINNTTDAPTSDFGLSNDKKLSDFSTGAAAIEP